jgi:hypothetical protein
MSDGERAHHAPRARPFSDPALEALLERTRELARRWAVALVLERSLDDLGQVPLELLAREAPALCGQLLRALRSESELALLIGDDDGGSRGGAGLARRIGALAGARDSAALIAAVEALRGVAWEALLAELDQAGPGTSHTRRLADASDRLAHVCSALLPAALTAAEPGKPEHEEATGLRMPPVEPSTAAEQAPDSAASGARERIVIVDERRHQPQVEPRLSERDPIAAPEPSGVSEIEVRDERGDEGPAAWIGSIGHQLERFEQDRMSFAVLLVELSPGQPAFGLTDALEAALVSTLRDSAGSLTRERDGRYWLLAPHTDRSGAGDLTERVSIAAAAAGAAKGVEVAVAVGSAVCPQDGRQASSLAAHADIGLYAARSRAHSRGLAAVPVEES